MSEQGKRPPATPSGIDQLLSLSGQFGGQDKIPLDALTQIGYQRIDLPEGGTKLRPLDYIPPSRESKHRWEEKVQDTPFAETPIKYSGAEMHFRFLDEDALRILSAKYGRINFYEYWESNHEFELTSVLEELDETSPLSVFKKDFVRFLQLKDKSGGNESGTPSDFHQLSPQDIENFVFKWFSTIPLIEHVRGRLDVTHLDYYLEYDVTLGENVLTKEKSKEVFEDLDRTYGIVDDVPEQERIFDETMNGNMDSKNIEELSPALVEYSNTQGIQTAYQFIMHCFSRYLQNIGHDELAEKLGKAKTIQEARTLTGEVSFAQSLIAEEKKLRQQIKSSSIEEKMAISGQLKSIAEQKKKLRQIQFGMQQYFSMPKYLSGLYHKVVKDVQDNLVAGKGKDQQTGFLYLDATPNEKLDKDPGAVSGDCTTGAPLPFDRPEVPVYNVKVFDADKKHIGNMYLLVTKALGGNDKARKVWHFDAIQVPKSSIDWEETMADVISSIGPIAEEKGIQLITVNEEEHNISNYDYIQEGVNTYWKKHGGEMIGVDMLEGQDMSSGRDNRYSSFQGTGVAKILWKKMEKV